MALCIVKHSDIRIGIVPDIARSVIKGQPPVLAVDFVRKDEHSLTRVKYTERGCPLLCGGWLERGIIQRFDRAALRPVDRILRIQRSWALMACRERICHRLRCELSESIVASGYFEVRVRDIISYAGETVGESESRVPFSEVL